MKLSNVEVQRAVIAIGTGLVIATGFVVSQAMMAKNGCVRTVLTSGKAATGQEIVYSWGCVAPQRFRQWSVMASVKPTDAGSGSNERLASRSRDPRARDRGSGHTAPAYCECAGAGQVGCQSWEASAGSVWATPS